MPKGLNLVVANLGAYLDRLDAAIYSLANNVAGAGEEWMKVNQPRTGMQLFTTVERRRGWVRINFCHEVEYGTYLTLCSSGMYDILIPARNKFGPMFFDAARKVMRG